MVMRRWGTVILGLVFLLTVLSFFYTPYRPEQIQISRRLQPPLGCISLAPIIWVGTFSAVFWWEAASPF